MPTMQADIICFAAHKTLCGPLGVGGFAIRHGVTLKKILAGGTGSNSLNLDMPNQSPDRYEASSQNVVAIAGLQASLKELDLQGHRAKIEALTKYLLNRLDEVSTVKVLGFYRDGHTLGIVSFVVEGYQSDEVGSILDEEFNIAVRTGFHCAPYIHDYLMDKPYNGTIRIGLGQFNTTEDIDALISALESL
jgi:selenocysteine lyase/cysteine desulfurase